jgi:hypothetical protein
MTGVRTVLGVLLLTGFAAAQAPMEMPALPSGNGGWLLHVSTRGGIMGNGAGEFAIASDGVMRCTRPCAPTAAEHFIGSLRDAVRLAANESWVSLPANSMCSDCLVTYVSLTIRNEDGTIDVVSASWDPTTRARLPHAVTRVTDLARQALSRP